MRVKITLACTECKQRNYNTMKNKKNDPDRLEMNKYCRFCRKHVLHRETKQVRGTLIMAETKPNVFVRFGKGIARFFRDGKAEVKKVVRTKPSTVFKNAGIVLLIIVVLGAFIFGLDTLLMYLLGLIMNIAHQILDGGWYNA